jgi:DNA-binding NarL/FixJ family response regulator
LLLNNNAEISFYQDTKKELKFIDKIFVWNGDSRIFFTMIKLLEDNVNVENDTKIGFSRVILLVEDSAKYYSRYLPILYTSVLEQTKRIIDEISKMDELYKILRLRARPKVMLATNYEQAKHKLLVIKPDLILCDINLNSEKTGIELMKEIDSKYNIPYVFISAYSDIKTLKEANKASPYAYITKPFNEKQLIATINGLFAAIEHKDGIIPTEKELSVLKYIAKGYATKQIAEELALSHHTIETHRKNLMNKYGVKSMPEMICLATYKGWIEYKDNY